MAQKKKVILAPKIDRSLRSARTRRAGRICSDLRLFEQLVQSVALFLVSQGVKRSTISASLGRALADAGRLSKDAASLQTLYVAISKVLHAWHQDPSYLDADARPIPLRLRGKGPSVETLLRCANTRTPIDKVVNSLKSQELIRAQRPGYFLPTTSVAQIRTSGPELTGYIGQSILQLISTLHSNHTSKAGQPMLERAAIVQDLPIREIQRFRRYSAEQGTNFIASTNGWLETRRKNKADAKSGKVVTAGVHVFAFVTPPPRD